MADSERLSAPGCWAACTSYWRTRKGILLFAEIVSAAGPAGGQRRSGGRDARYGTVSWEAGTWAEGRAAELWCVGFRWRWKLRAQGQMVGFGDKVES